MIGIAGASRMSSVRGLNARPQTAIVLPFRSPKCCCIFATSRAFCRSFTASTALQDLEVVALVGGELAAAPCTSFGKQLPP